MTTYVFVDRDKFAALEEQVRKLSTPPSAPPKAKLLHWQAIAAVAWLLLGAVISAALVAGVAPTSNQVRGSVAAFVVCVVIGQACIDLHPGKNKPAWSAGFRLLALGTWWLSQLIG